MAFRRKKESWLKKIFSHKIFITVIGLCLIVFISIPMAKNISKRYVINQEIEKMQAEIRDMEKKNSELSGLVEYLDSDEFIAEQARLNLNYKKAGEEMVVIKNKDEVASAKDKSLNNNYFDIKGADNLPDKPIKNPKQWINYFFNKNKI